MVSSFSRHIKHLFANAHPFFWTISKVKALPCVASHAKKLILGCTFTFQIQLEGNRDGQPASRPKQRDLAENFPLFVLVQDTISSTSSNTLLPCSCSKNLYASSSQSLKALEKQGFQPLQSFMVCLALIKFRGKCKGNKIEKKNRMNEKVKKNKK